VSGLILEPFDQAVKGVDASHCIFRDHVRRHRLRRFAVGVDVGSDKGPGGMAMLPESLMAARAVRSRRRVARKSAREN